MIPPHLAGSRLTAVVCRDCCCGSTDKHPRTDHDGHLARLRQACADHPHARVVVSRCLGRCTSSNVVVVRTRQLGHPRTEVWLGGLHDDADIESLSGWVRSGGAPAELPAELGPHVLGPRHRERVAVPVTVRRVEGTRRHR